MRSLHLGLLHVLAHAHQLLQPVIGIHPLLVRCCCCNALCNLGMLLEGALQWIPNVWCMIASHCTKYYAWGEQAGNATPGMFTDVVCPLSVAPNAFTGDQSLLIKQDAKCAAFVPKLVLSACIFDQCRKAMPCCGPNEPHNHNTLVTTAH